jgi:hypothetical protein
MNTPMPRLLSTLTRKNGHLRMVRRSLVDHPIFLRALLTLLVDTPSVAATRASEAKNGPSRSANDAMMYARYTFSAVVSPRYAGLSSCSRQTGHIRIVSPFCSVESDQIEHPSQESTEFFPVITTNKLTEEGVDFRKKDDIAGEKPKRDERPL